MLLESDTLPSVMGVLQAAHFYVPAHREIYKAIQVLYSLGKPVDLLTLREQLIQTGRLQMVGGDLYLVSLTNHVLTGAHAERHAHLVREKYVLRELTLLATQARNKAYAGNDAAQLLDHTTLQLLKLRSNLGDNTMRQVAETASQNMLLLDRLSRSEEALPGIATGFYELDRTLGGLQAGMKIEVAGRPGMGKSAFALSIINHVAVELGMPVAFFSLEMPAAQQEMRLKSMRTQVPFHRLQKGNIHAHEWDSLIKQTERIAAAPLYIDDSGHLSTMELRSKCLHLKHHAGLELVVIDYLQLMHQSNHDNKQRNKESEIADISRATKQLAQDLGIAVIEVSQLNRNAESRADKRPMLSDLRESGSIEQDADVVLFPFRPGYYGKQNPHPPNEPTEAELIIAKHRNGPCRNIPVKFQENTMTFS